MTRRNKKGISPLVAVIMLIAFTMIVAGILAGWATRFATEQRESLEKCTSASFQIQRATYDVASTNVTLMLYNPSRVPLRDFNVIVSFDENGPPLPDTLQIKDTLDPNTFETYQINLTNTSVEYIEVRSVECQGAVDLVNYYDIVGLP